MKKLVLSAILVSVLAGCGGGGSSGNPSPEGYWQGVSSPGYNMTSGYNVSMLVLENGETWAVYEGVPPSVPQWPFGGLYGTTTSSGTSLSGSGQAIAISVKTGLGFAPGSYSGTFTPKSTISLTTSPSFTTGVAIDAKYEPGYDQPASLADVAGTFNGAGAASTSPPQDISVTVDSSGAFTLPFALMCGGSGKLTPRASGKNVFDVTATLGVGCKTGGPFTVTGTAYYERATRRLVLVAVGGPDQTVGVVYIGHD